MIWNPVVLLHSIYYSNVNSKDIDRARVHPERPITPGLTVHWIGQFATVFFSSFKLFRSAPLAQIRYTRANANQQTGCFHHHASSALHWQSANLNEGYCWFLLTSCALSFACLGPIRFLRIRLQRPSRGLIHAITTIRIGNGNFSIDFFLPGLSVFVPSVVFCRFCIPTTVKVGFSYGDFGGRCSVVNGLARTRWAATNE